MKASELRIGNWVYLFGDALPLEKDHLIYLLTEDRTAEPITLTEEWFVKFGFREFYGEMRLDTDGGVISKLCGKWYVYSGFGSGEDYGCAVDLQFVHQLQNLYYSLTGEELTVKP